MLVVDGELPAIHQLHYHLLELFVDPTLLEPTSPGGLYGSVGGVGAGRPTDPGVGRNAVSNTVPVSSLLQLGVSPTFVHKLRYILAYTVTLLSPLIVLPISYIICTLISYTPRTYSYAIYNACMLQIYTQKCLYYIYHIHIHLYCIYDREMQEYLSQNYDLDLNIARPSTDIPPLRPMLDRHHSITSLGSIGSPSVSHLGSDTSGLTDRSGSNGEVSFSAPAELVGMLLDADSALKQLEVRRKLLRYYVFICTRIYNILAVSCLYVYITHVYMYIM